MGCKVLSHKTNKLKLYDSPLNVVHYFSVPWTKTKIQSIHVAVEQVAGIDFPATKSKITYEQGIRISVELQRLHELIGNKEVPYRLKLYC